MGMAVINFGQFYSFMSAGEKLTTRVREICFRAMERQSIAFFDKEENTSGSLSAKLSDDASKVCLCLCGVCLCMSVCVCAYVCVCMCAPAHIALVYTRHGRDCCVSAHVRVNTGVCVCVYIYIYIHAYTGTFRAQDK
jgi:hypothetical protein